jgi:hypothetical protein
LKPEPEPKALLPAGQPASGRPKTGCPCLSEALAAGVETRERHFRQGEHFLQIDRTTSRSLLDRIEKALVRVRKHPSHIPEKPVDVLLPGEKNPAQKEAETPFGIADAVSECKSRPPRSAEHRPLVDAKRDA